MILFAINFDCNKMAKHFILLCALFLGGYVFADSKKLAQEVPIADVHRHVQSWVSPQQLKEEMSSHNVRWSGAVGAPFGPFDTSPYQALLGKGYIQTTGQVELGRIYSQHGAAGLTDINNSTYQELLKNSDELFSSGKIKGFGELILNNKSTNPNVAFRRKVAIDSPPLEAIFSIANKYKAFVQIHAEDDEDSVSGIKNLASKFKDVNIILSHCLFTSNTEMVRDLLKSHPNTYCELSARSRSHFPNPTTSLAQQRIIYSEDGIKSEWVQLIEDFPERFMVGTDTFNANVNFERNIREIRLGLLPALKSTTIEMVAFKNAVRVMRLD